MPWQIMDPKMDSACKDPHDEAVELYDVRKELLPDEVLGIMDQLLCHEVWCQISPTFATWLGLTNVC